MASEEDGVGLFDLSYSQASLAQDTRKAWSRGCLVGNETWPFPVQPHSRHLILQTLSLSPATSAAFLRVHCCPVVSVPSSQTQSRSSLASETVYLSKNRQTAALVLGEGVCSLRDCHTCREGVLVIWPASSQHFSLFKNSGSRVVETWLSS